MAQQLRVSAALAEDMCSVPSTHMAAHIYLWMKSSWRQSFQLLKVCDSNNKAIYSSRIWFTPEIPEPQRWRQEDQDFRAMLSYVVNLREVWLT